MERETLKRYLSLAVIILLVTISIFIARPYVIALISAFIFAFLIRPVYLQLTKTFRPSLAAAICVVALLLVIILPFVFVIVGTVLQIQTLFSTADWTIYLAALQDILARFNIAIELPQITRQLAQILITGITALTARLPTAIISVFITILGTYYMLLDWNTLTNRLTKYIPSQHRNHLPNELGNVTRSLIYGTLLIAIIEFVIATIGFAIAGVKAYLLLAFLIAIFAFIPALGPAIVWVPLTFFLFVQGNYSAAIIVGITGLIISLYIDNILRIQITGKSTRIHPLIMLIGIFGGITIFGILGFVIGPLILAYTIKFIESLADA